VVKFSQFFLRNDITTGKTTKATRKNENPGVTLPGLSPLVAEVGSMVEDTVVSPCGSVVGGIDVSGVDVVVGSGSGISIVNQTIFVSPVFPTISLA
jgi:hypothetical protein